MNEVDRELLALLQHKHSLEKGFERLLATYQKPLYVHLRRMLGNHPDADDALQNTFIKVWKNVANFRGDSALYSWLYRIATNEALAIIEKGKRSHLHTVIDDEAHASAKTDGPDGDAISRVLQAAILTLPLKQRQVFDLRYFEEMPYEQIAELTGTSVGALKASYFHAVKKVEAFISATS